MLALARWHLLHAHRSPPLRRFRQRIFRNNNLLEEPAESSQGSLPRLCMAILVFFEFNIKVSMTVA